MTVARVELRTTSAVDREVVTVEQRGATKILTIWRPVR